MLNIECLKCGFTYVGKLDVSYKCSKCGWTQAFVTLAKKNKVYVPENEITSLPSGWNEDATVLHSEYVYTLFDFLNDPREDGYSLEDGEGIEC